METARLTSITSDMSTVLTFREMRKNGTETERAVKAKERIALANVINISSGRTGSVFCSLYKKMTQKSHRAGLSD
jgi:hypothetical protein